MLTHWNSHRLERPSGQDEATRRRTLALMLQHANRSPGPLSRGVAVLRDAVVILGLVALSAAGWIALNGVLALVRL